MDMLVVRGGQPLRGSVEISGSKNAALPVMAAALAIDGPTTLHRIPQLADVQILTELLTRLGLSIQSLSACSLRMEVTDSAACIAGDDLVRKMRASICVLGPLLGRRGRACVSLPGGCQIGQRPIDLHLRGLTALGADITLERGYIIARADRLRGATISLAGAAGSTVTGTCNVMTAACFAKGRTTLTGAACEPEVIDLGNFLNQAGARISGLGTSVIEIDGVERLTSTEYTIIPDRIEAATYLIAAAITGGRLQLHHTCPEYLTSITDSLRRLGAAIHESAHGLTISAPAVIEPLEIATSPYPGLPTDVQAQFTALLSLARGTSRIVDRVFPDRFLHLPELCRMGCDVRRIADGCEIRGVPRLSGASVVATDLRAGAALLLAALAADGESVIRRIDHLDRGYENLEQKLARLGADIQRVPDDAAHLPASLQPRLDSGLSTTLPGPHWTTTPQAVSQKWPAGFERESA